MIFGARRIPPPTPRAMDRPRAVSLRRLLAALLLPAATACGGSGGAEAPTGPEPELPVLAEVPALGEDGTLELGTWNLEWFGDPGNGPEDEARQLRRVAHVLGGLDVDVWSVQEVVRPDHFQALLDALPGYRGFLADDPSVAGGAAHYSDFGGNELKVGLLYRAEEARVDSARVVLREADRAFAGRPPVEVHLTLDPGGTPRALVVVLLHAKAGAGAEDRDRRETGARALKAYLDDAFPDAAVAVLGDFNDDVDASIRDGAPSPYRVFVEDPGGYRFLTASLSAADATSTVFYSDVIDHHLGTDELAADFVEGSAVVVPADAYVPEYGETTSDHYPVVTRYRPGG